MILNYPPPYDFSFTIDKTSDIVPVVRNILNKKAESRYDGTNAQLVNNMQPELDFAQDTSIVNEAFVKRIDSLAEMMAQYLKHYGLCRDEEGEEIEYRYQFCMAMPYNWKRQLQKALERKAREYVIHGTIADYLENVSLDDIQYTLAKADELLFEVKNLCEARQHHVDFKYNTPY